MPPTYRKINYGIRVAKSVERKMMCDTIAQLAAFQPLAQYTYVGFGSPFFEDFSLFHRRHGLRRMVNIEKDCRAAKKRIEFNRPFACIEPEYGDSFDVLPGLNCWASPAVVWLDYDTYLGERHLRDDVETLAAKLQAGSLFALTFTVEPHKRETGIGDVSIFEYRRERFRASVSSSLCPVGVDTTKIRKWELADLTAEAVDSYLRSAVGRRNDIDEEPEPLRVVKAFEYRYQDGARMMTVGYITVEDGQLENVGKLGFDSLPTWYPRAGPIEIQIPSLTRRELRHLDSQLPCNDPASISVPGVPESDIAKYIRTYRHFPRFANVEGL